MWNAVRCAVQGHGHIKAGVPCQDKTFAAAGNGVEVIALADGAGSARLSHYGAETVTRFICSELIERFDFYYSNDDGIAVKKQLMEGVLGSLMRTANKLQCDLKDLASTLLFVAVKGEQLMMAHIGDGVIGYLKGDELKVASQPENGEFANTTVFTTSKDALVTMRLIKGLLGNINGFVLMSDGTEVSLYSKRERKLADVLKKVMHMSDGFSAEEVQEQLQESFEKVIVNTTTDDCSIALLVRKKPVVCAYMDYEKLPKIQKRIFLGLHNKAGKRLLRRYDDIFYFLVEGKTLRQISVRTYMQKKHVRRCMNRLCMLNLLVKDGGCYRTTLGIEKE